MTVQETDCCFVRASASFYALCDLMSESLPEQLYSTLTDAVVVVLLDFLAGCG